MNFYLESCLHNTAEHSVIVISDSGWITVRIQCIIYLLLHGGM